MKTLAANLTTLGNLSGVFSVTDVWGKAPSGYVVTLDGGQLLQARCPNSPGLAFAVILFPGYMARGFGLLQSLAACCYEPRAVSGEDRLGLGELNA